MPWLDKTLHRHDVAACVYSGPNSSVPRHWWHWLVLTAVLWSFQVRLLAQAGGYLITQLAITNATHPSINNSGEVVWAVQNGSGIYSSVRGQMSATGMSPHLANSGEVVYADMFQGPDLDLVSTTRGRLTFGGFIQLGFSDFDVNASGEVVYVASTNSNQQVFSTVRGQVTFDLVDHYNPCINDLGEILWNRHGQGRAWFHPLADRCPAITP